MYKRQIHTALNSYAFSKPNLRDKIITNFEQDFQFYRDENLLVFVIFNLLKNALYYVSNCPKGEIQLWSERSNDKNILYFKDNGPGISQENLPYIFEHFMTSGKKQDGTGLGLVFCRRVMNAFSGDISCHSVEGDGATFILSFPLI